MSKRGILRAVLVVALGCGVVWGSVAWWTRDRVIEAGSAVVFVEGRDLSLGESYVGVGVEGTLGLVGGRCVGLVGETGDDGSVIIWPSGTTVSGSGESVAITSRGVTVRIGDEVDDAGTGQGEATLSGFRERLPAECQDAAVMDLRLGG